MVYVIGGNRFELRQAAMRSGFVPLFNQEVSSSKLREILNLFNAIQKYNDGQFGWVQRDSITDGHRCYGSDFHLHYNNIRC